MNSNWNYPTTVWVGENRIEDLYKACTQLLIKKPLFVADKDLKAKLEHEIKTELHKANMAQIEVNKIEAQSKN